jgi:hypothetical protein
MLIASVAILLLAAVVALSWFLLRPTTSPMAEELETDGIIYTGPEITEYTPPPLTVPDPIGSTIDIGTSRGIVTVKNFFPAAIEKTDDFVVITSSDKYDILYFRGASTFLISLSATPITENKLEAERELLSILGIDETQACKLNASTGVPSYVDLERAGTSYGLSFCPDF